MKYIDAHVHITPAGQLGKVNERYHTQLLENGYKKKGDEGFYIMPPYMHDSQFTSDTLIATMDAYGIEKAVILQTLMAEVNQDVADAVRKYPGRLAGAMVVEPKAGFKEEMIRWHEAGLNIIKFEMRAQSDLQCYRDIIYTSSEMMEMFEIAEQLGLTVTIDPAPTNFSIYRPDALEEAISAFPNVRFVLCHLGYPRPLETKEEMERWHRMIEVTAHKNCWVDCAAMPDMFNEEGYPYPSALKVLKEVIQVAGIDSVIWGTDITGTLTKATYPQMMDMYQKTDYLRETDLQKIYYDNAISAYKF